MCETKLETLRQTKSAASYFVEFAKLSAPLELNDEALCLNFYHGLHTDVKNKMAIVGRASTYDALVKQAISIDQRIHQRHLETKSESGSSSNAQTKSRTKSNPPKPNPPNSHNAKYYKSQPRSPLSEEEKDRHKRLSLCIYCASPKHSVENCPGIAAKDAKVNILSLPPPRYPQPSENSPQSENSKPQAPTRTEAWVKLVSAPPLYVLFIQWNVLKRSWTPFIVLQMIQVLQDTINTRSMELPITIMQKQRQ